MRLLLLAGSALVLLSLLACGGSPDEVWLSEQAPYRPEVVPTPAPRDTAASARSPFTSVSLGGRLICGVRADGSVTCVRFAKPDEASAYARDIAPSGIEAPAPEGRFTSVSVGYRLACGVREDGSVACWGQHRYDVPELRPPEGAFRSVSVGESAACGVRKDGSVACWGDVGYDVPELRPPEGAFRSVSVGGFYACGVRESGAVACWGAQVVWPDRASMGAFRSVSAGFSHACGVREDGSLACWRSEEAVACGAREDATFTCWTPDSEFGCEVRADDSFTCLDETSTFGIITPPPGTFAAVSVGGVSSCGVREDGTLNCWRRELDQVCESGGGSVTCRRVDGESDGHGSTAPPRGAFTAVSIDDGGLGDSSGCGVREDGSLACWNVVRHFPGASLRITGGTASSLTLEWVSSPGEGAAADYQQLLASSSPEGPYRLVASSIEENPAVVGGLDPDTTYFLVAFACDEFGCSPGEWAVAVTEAAGPANVPATPTGFRGEKIVIDRNVDRARLTWNAVEEATYYELWKGSDPDLQFELLARISAPLEAQTVGTAPNRGIFGEYLPTSWKVRACNKAGCSAFTNAVTIE